MDIKRGLENLDRALLPGEQVEWKGKPEPFALLSGESRKPILIQWILCAAACVILSAVYIGASLSAGLAVSPIVELVIIAACILVATTPLRDRHEVLKKTRYYVTNMRVILMVGDNFYALNRSGIKTEMRRTAEGNLHILFGSCAGMSTWKYRRAASLPDIDGENLSRNGFVFYNVRQDRAYLEQLLVKTAA